MHQLYDRGYKKLFSNKMLFRQLIESFVPYEWVKTLDFDHCELLDKSFLSKEYEKRESDIIYKIRLKGKIAYIIILVEFQSSTDKFMAVRVAHYVYNFYMRLIESKEKPNKLPPVFPIVLYNGMERWTAPTHMTELIENNELLGEFALDFKYFKIAENEIPIDRLLETGNAVSTLFIGEVQHDKALLRQALSDLLNKEELQVISILFNYFEQLFKHGKMNEIDWHNLDKVRTQQEINMFLESMKVSDEKVYQKAWTKGRTEGFIEGEHKGEHKGILKTAKAMLEEGTEISFIAKVTGLSIEEIERLRH